MESMLPSLLIAGAGLALKGIGTATSVDAAQRKSEAEIRIAQNEQLIQAQRNQASALDYQRKTLQSIRDQQKTRALALTHATSQGAENSSGLQGGYGQISGDANTSRLALDQNWEIAQNVFGLNSKISTEKMNIAGTQADAAFGTGMSSLGGDLISSSGTFGKFFQQGPKEA